MKLLNLVRLHVQTRVACRMLNWQRTTGRVSDPSGWGPHKFYIDAQTLAAASHLLPLDFFVLFVF
jgi:hypothetical protein